MTVLESQEWIQEISNFKLQISNNEIIVCPSFTTLAGIKIFIEEHNLPVKLGAQDISPFDEGAYTGEVNGKQLKEFVSYVIIGHSERRELCKETDEIIAEKIEQAVKNELIPIICISGITQVENIKLKMQNNNAKVKSDTSVIIAYEPLTAIGSGEADTPDHAQQMAEIIKKEIPEAFVLYGGSVTPENAQAFFTMSDIDGVLVGGASLDPKRFAAIISYAQEKK